MMTILNMMLARLYTVSLGLIIATVGLVSPTLALQIIQGKE